MPQTNVSEWRKKKQEGEWKELPSGLRVRVKRLSLLEMACAGSIPTGLSAQADDLLRKSISPQDAITKYIDVIRLHAITAIQEPRVVPTGQTPKDDEISISEFDADDLLAVFNWLNTSPATLLSFLEIATR
jgi:hypothetical protein